MFFAALVLSYSRASRRCTWLIALVGAGVAESPPGALAGVWRSLVVTAGARC